MCPQHVTVSSIPVPLPTLPRYNGRMSVETALQALRLEARFMRNISRWEITPARPARYASFPPELDLRLIDALAGRGVIALYTHQADAVAAALRGEHVAVVTPAASGKTLCYNLPVLNRLLADPSARALYLFPTKALAQDQLAELRELAGLLNGVGETSRQGNKGAKPLQTLGASSPRPLLSPLLRSPAQPTTATRPRRSVPRCATRPRIILSNPDMLHAGILPQHPRWAGFFANLRVVVIDEMHVCRGVFGSHIANVLRRLRRVCRFYGSDPQFILASATIANPAELAERLVEAPVTLISPERDGAPQSEKHVLFYNPPLIDPDLGLRRSSSLEASDLAAQFLAHSVQTIVFARARLTMELILTHLRETSQQASGIRGQASTIRGYRGGYLPAERREIEKGLREGSVRGVVATSALELGIDIGALDAAVLAGYPGTVASARQQMGRAGRRRGSSIGVLVAGAGAMDQYILTHPEWLLARSPEHARINPDNDVILAHHLTCAAAEMPIEKNEQFLGKLPGTAVDLLDDLVEAGQLYRSGSRYYWAGDGSPASAVSLRTASPERIVIQATDGGGRPQVIGELERESAPILLYEGAIYLHEGQSYLVEQLDWEAGLARVRATEVDFYTRPISSEKIEVLRTLDEGRKTKDEYLPIVSNQQPASSFQLPVCLGRCACHQPDDRLQDHPADDPGSARFWSGDAARAGLGNPGLLADPGAGTNRAAESRWCVVLRPERVRGELADAAQRRPRPRRVSLPGLRHGRGIGPAARRTSPHPVPRVPGRSQSARGPGAGIRLAGGECAGKPRHLVPRVPPSGGGRRAHPLGIGRRRDLAGRHRTDVS